MKIVLDILYTYKLCVHKDVERWNFEFSESQVKRVNVKSVSMTVNNSGPSDQDSETISIYRSNLVQ